MAIIETLYDNRWPLAASVLVIYLMRKIYTYYRLSQFKGPFGVGFSEIPHNWATFKPDTQEWYRHVTDTYGPIARVGPNTLITSDPDVWMHVNNKPGYKRSNWYYHAARVEYRRDNVFTMTDNAEHDRRRKALAPGYSGRDFLNIELHIDARVQDFVDLIRRKYLSSDDRVVRMDLSKKMQFFTLDVISTVGLGKPFGMLAADEDVHDFVKSADEGMEAANLFLALGLSGLAQMPFIGKYILPSPKDDKGMGKLVGVCFQYADDREARPVDDKSDMLSSWMRHGVTGAALRSEACEQVIAGSDTTAGALRGIMLQLMSNSRVYAKLQREIDEAVSNGLVAENGAGIISYATAKQLPYLQAVVREGTRWWPSVTNFFPRDIPPGGDTVMVDGKPVFLPGGAEIGYCALGILRGNKATFGEDADSFRPERWLESDPDKYAEMVRVGDMLFGYGKFQCLGKPVAQYELSKAIFELMRNFDWAVDNPTKPWETVNTMGLFVIRDLWVQVTERR